ncbi:MAG: hypothetical protein HYR85_10390 [Planctomycetes bacterium]|nr:hypothetical protein [Planctomycetota bacterium]MBI3847158.1 hypothetical protein [Planctomycetota bacterium]
MTLRSFVRLITASTFLLGAAPLRAQDAPAASDTVDTSFHAPLHRPLLVTGTLKVAGKMILKADAREITRPVNATGDMEFVDEILTSTKDESSASRTIVKSFGTDNGDISDPPFNGLTLTFTQKGKDVTMAFGAGQMTGKDDADALFREWSSVGFWLPLPAKARIGESYTVSLNQIATLLLSNDLQENTGEARLRLDAFDAEKSAARFRGKATLTEKGDVGGIASTITYDCDCMIETLGAEGRIASLTITGAFKAEGSGAVALRGSGTYAVTFRTQIGAPAEAARRQKPVYRDHVRAIESVGAKFSLPSYWGEVQGLEVTPSFRRCLDGNAIAIVSLQRVDENCADPKAYYQALLEKLKTSYKDIKVEKVTSPLGAGQAYSFESESDGKKTMVHSEIYPLGDHSVIVKLVADPKAYPAALQELVKARSTLKPLPK